MLPDRRKIIVFSPPPKPPPMNRRRPYRFVHPLRGCGGTRGNALGYRDASPNGDKGCNQHLGARNISATTPPRWEDYRHTVFTATPPRCDGATTTLNSPLSTLNSSHTFSAKERDSETGLSYFGARYYSSDLSIWLSVDPQVSKYPSSSPYVYCADNPVIFTDPNGEDIVLETIYKKDANDKNTSEIERYNIKITGKIINNSGMNIDMSEAKEQIVSQIESSFSGVTESGIPVTTTADFEVVNSLMETSPSDHIITLSNNVKLDNGMCASGKVNDIGRKKAWVDAHLFKGPVDAIMNNGGKAAAHEMGHLMGLRHCGRLFNLMRSPRLGTNITSKQLSSIVAYLHHDKKITSPAFRIINRP